jgi:hypothetical protein
MVTNPASSKSVTLGISRDKVKIASVVQVTMTRQIEEQHIVRSPFVEEFLQFVGDDVSRLICKKFNRELTDFGITQNFRECLPVQNWDSQALVSMVVELVARN